MSLNQQWNDLIESYNDHHVHDENCNHDHHDFHSFWQSYYEAEKVNYQKILASKQQKLSGTVSALAEQFSMTPVIFFGFLGGINTSLKEELDLDPLEEDSEINAEIDFEKLYFNMHGAKADWLYNLPEWEDILSEQQRREIVKEYRASIIATAPKVPGRNDPCHCGSGKKYKQCHGKVAN